MKDTLLTKCVLSYFYEFRSFPSVQPHRSNTLSPPQAKFTPSNQTMEPQPILDEIMTKIENLLQIMNSSNQNSKSNVPCVILTVRESKKSRAINVNVIRMLLPTVQTPNSFKIVINDGVLIEAPKPDSTISSKVTLVI